MLIIAPYLSPLKSKFGTACFLICLPMRILVPHRRGITSAVIFNSLLITINKEQTISITQDVMTRERSQTNHLVCQGWHIKWVLYFKQQQAKKDTKRYPFLELMRGLSSQLSKGPPDLSPKFAQQGIARQIWSSFQVPYSLKKQSHRKGVIAFLELMRGLEPLTY